MADTIRTLWSLDPGEHVCWQVSSPTEYAEGQRRLVEHAARAGGHVIIVGSAGAVGPSPRVSVIEPAGYAAAARRARVLEAMRGELDQARRDGDSVRVLAGMEYLSPPHTAFEDLVVHELDVAELAGDAGASLVCAYARHAWRAQDLQDLAAVHSRVVGEQPSMPNFRMIRLEANRWSLEGSIGFESRRAFSATLRAALLRTPHTRLWCARLDLIDAAGLQTLVETVKETPGCSIRMDRANDTVLSAWRMSGYGAYGAAIEVSA